MWFSTWQLLTDATLGGHTGAPTTFWKYRRQTRHVHDHRLAVLLDSTRSP